MLGKIIHAGFGGKTEGKRSLERPRHRWEKTIKKVDHRELGWVSVG